MIRMHLSVCRQCLAEIEESCQRSKDTLAGDFCVPDDTDLFLKQIS